MIIEIDERYIWKVIDHSRAVKVKSTSVDNDKINGPCFYGSYVAHIIMYPSVIPSRTNSSDISFQGTNLIPSLFIITSFEGSTLAGYT